MLKEISGVELQKKNKNRVNVFINGEYACAMFLEFAIKHGIKAGAKIEEEKLNAIVQESDGRAAFDKAMALINRTLKTVSQIRKYLTEKEYDKQIINSVIKKLMEYNYLNDENYAKIYVNTYKHKYGKAKLKLNLLGRGIAKSVIEETLENTEEQKEEVFTLAKKFLKGQEANFENLGKVYRRLVSRGFSFEEAKSAINKLKQGGEEDAAWN